MIAKNVCRMSDWIRSLVILRTWDRLRLLTCAFFLIISDTGDLLKTVEVGNC